MGINYQEFSNQTWDFVMSPKENDIVSASVVDQDLSMEWIIMGGTFAGLLVIGTIIAVIIIWRCLRKYENKDKDSFTTRYSSSDTNESLNDTQLLEDPFKPSLTTFHIQPKSHNSQYQRNLLSVNQPDVSGTSDEEEAQIVANTPGRIWFTVRFNDETNQLKIVVVKARYLKGRGMAHEPRDPFVRVYLLPDELHYQQSKARRKTLSPRFNETFTFQLTRKELTDRVIKLSMYDIDKRNVRHSLGHALVPLDKIDLSSDSLTWRNLETITQRTSQVGELLFSLCCNPYTDRIKVSVLQGRSLSFKKIENLQLADIFIRVELFYGPKLIKTKDTTRQKFNENPNVFQNFAFSIVGKHFDSCSISFTLMLIKDSSSDYKNAIPCGKVVVGSYLFARREQLQHWQEMMANPRTPTERWHYLTEIT